MKPAIPVIEIPVIEDDILRRRTCNALRLMTDARDAQDDPMDRWSYPSAIALPFEHDDISYRSAQPPAYTLFFDDYAESRSLGLMAEDVQMIAGHALAVCLEDMWLSIKVKPHILRMMATSKAQMPKRVIAYCTPDAVLFVRRDLIQDHADTPNALEAFRRDMSSAFVLVLNGEPSSHQAFSITTSLDVLICSEIRTEAKNLLRDLTDDERRTINNTRCWRFRKS